MATDEVPIEVSAFLRAHIESYEQLETLLLLNSHPTRQWTSADIAATLKVSESEVLDALELLLAAGLVRVESNARAPSYSFAPTDAVVSEVVARLAALYTDRRVDVMKLMSAHAIARVRDAALRTFSDAFLLNGKKKDG